MKLIRKLDSIDSSMMGGALTIGNFDGVHRGHAQIVERLKHWADQVDGPSTVFTFDPHPVRLLRPELAPPPLTWTERKAELLGKLGVDHLIAYPTDQQMLALSYREFFEKVIRDRLDAKAIVEGPNFYFGNNREGDVAKLKELCHSSQMACEIVQPISMNDDWISSTRIRQAIIDGEVGKAAEMLTEPYRIRGMVVHGAGRGVELGFPTANLDAIDTLIPGMGVYAGHATAAGSTWRAALNIGPSPTFGEDLPKVEVHLLDFDDALYGQVMEVDFRVRLRSIQQFSSVDELKIQLKQDIERARTIE